MVIMGLHLGTGLILAACGAFALGWAVRHQRPLEATAVPETAPRRFGRRARAEVAPADVASPGATEPERTRGPGYGGPGSV